MQKAIVRSVAILSLWVAICTCISIPITFAQATIPTASTNPNPAFEVATIKLIDRNGYKGSGIVGFLSEPGGRVVLDTADLKMMIYYAFNVQGFQIAGLPAWTNTERYDIMALPPDSSPSRTAKQAGHKVTPSDEQREMLQSLLADRFALKYHRETREGPVYILGKSTSQKLHLEEPKDRDADSRGAIITRPGGISDGEAFGTNITMPFLTEMLTRDLKLPVIDQTGLTGSYDFHLEATDPTNQDHTQAVLDTVKRLGLTLKSGKGSVETIVIDNVSKPTEN